MENHSKTTVVIADTTAGLGASLEAIFAPFGGVRQAIPDNDGTIYIKVNGVSFAPHTHTSPAVLEALLAYLRDHGYTRLAVMEGCTAGNLTRLVFQATGYTSICRRYGAEPVYLDEGPTVPVALRDGTEARIARRLHDEILERGANVYISLPKLKTHSMTTVTLGVKNQQGFPIDADRMACHSGDTLHTRLAALYAMTQPDFCIIDGLYATRHGHLPPAALLDECLVPMNVLIGGPDTLAVDAVGARVLGYGVHEAEHLRLCAEWGLGEAHLADISVQGVPLGRFTERLPYTLLKRFHPDVHWVIGRTRACIEGCRGNSECIQEILYNDYGGRGGWTLVCGAGFEPGDLDDLPGDILVVGVCACREVGETLRRRYPGRHVYLVPEHNDLMNDIRYQCRLMGLKPLALAPLSPPRAALCLLQARLHRMTARIPPLLG